MSSIVRIASNVPWEPIYGYSRAVRAGDWLFVSGTTATDERGLVVGPGQMYVQAHQALLNLKAHIERAGLSLANIVRTRAFVTDITRFGEVARAHKELLGDNPPASTLVEVKALVNTAMLVEIEADVFAGGEKASRSEAPPKMAASKTKAAASKHAAKSKAPAKKTSSKTSSRKPARRR